MIISISNVMVCKQMLWYVSNAWYGQVVNNVSNVSSVVKRNIFLKKGVCNKMLQRLHARIN